MEIDEARRRIAEEIRTGVRDPGITDGQRFLLTPRPLKEWLAFGDIDDINDLLPPKD